MAAILISEFWYALSQIGKVVNQGGTKDTALSDEAFYYVRHVRSRTSSGYCFSKYCILNTLFEPITLKYNGIVGKDTELKESENQNYKDGKRLRFYFTDRSNASYSRDFGGGIDAFREFIQFMEELGNYGSLKEMTLTQKLEKLQEDKQAAKDAMMELETQNKKLQAQLDAIYDSKNDLRKLTELLYSEALSS